MFYDCVIVGLGPAGSSAAYCLAKKGLSVLALDRERFPRHKPCGGCLSYKAEKILDPDFKSVANYNIRGATFSYKGKRMIEYRNNDGTVGYMVNRDVFDAYLVRKAKDAGAKIIEGERVLNVEESEDRIKVTGANREYSGRYLIGADGVNSIVAKSLGLAKERKIFITLNAEVKTDYEGASDIVEIDMGAIPYGYGWVFPKDGYLDIGIASVMEGLINPKKYFWEFIKKRAFLKDIRIEKLYAFRLPTQITNNTLNVIGKNSILVGDAAGLTDPLVGEGIYYAIKSGQIAGDTIAKIFSKDSTLSDYSEKISKEFITEFSLAWKAGKIIYPRPRFWLSLIKRNTNIIDFYYKVLRGDDTYSGLLRRLKSIIGR